MASGTPKRDGELTDEEEERRERGKEKATSIRKKGNLNAKFRTDHPFPLSCPS